MSQPCTVLVAPTDLLPLLKPRAAEPGGEVVAFTDADAISALDAITERRPEVILLERLFAATPRGAALINRIKADPALVDSEIRVVSHDISYTRVSPRRAAAAGEVAPVHDGVGSTPEQPQQLDQRGTRQAPRFKVDRDAGILVDGGKAILVDLSTVGAQIVRATVLRPIQRVRLALTDDSADVRFSGVVAWANFEIPTKKKSQYRVGIEFIDADTSAIDDYRLRHKV